MCSLPTNIRGSATGWRKRSLRTSPNFILYACTTFWRLLTLLHPITASTSLLRYRVNIRFLPDCIKAVILKNWLITVTFLWQRYTNKKVNPGKRRGFFFLIDQTVINFYLVNLSYTSTSPFNTWMVRMLELSSILTR